MAWFFVVLGLVTLLLAGDFLVRAAVNLALRLGISALVVSLTVVAFGTSAPELLIVLSAMADDAPGLAMGNIVGSNTANILLVLGLPALAAGLYTTGFDTKKAFISMILATVLLGRFPGGMEGLCLRFWLRYCSIRHGQHAVSVVWHWRLRI